jgi:putative ABC transport system permease protein
VSVRQKALSIGRLAGDGVVAALRIAALLIAPFRIGRLFTMVSIPRFREHRVRTSLTVLGIALGIAVLVAVAVVNRSILQSVAHTIDDVAGKADLQVSAGSSGVDESLVESIRGVPGVYKAAAIVQQTVSSRDPHGGRERLLVLGVDFLNADDDYFRTYSSAEVTAIERDSFAFLNSPYNLVLSRSVAQRLGYKLHDRISLQTPSGRHDFDIWGFLGNEGVGKAFGGAVAVMDYGAMQVAFDRGKNVDRVDVAVTPGADAATVARAIRAAVGPGFIVEHPSHRNERVGYMLASLRNGLTMASFVALVVGMFLIYNAVSIGVVQRRREIGTLRALGATRRDLLLLFTLEGLLFGVVGSVVGVGFGLLLARVLLRSFEQSVSQMILAVPATDVDAGHTLLLVAALAGVVASTIAAALPARQAARLRPAETLRRGAAVVGLTTRRASFGRDAMALAAGVVAAALLRVPPVGGIAVGAAGSCLMLVLGAALLSPRLVQLTHAVSRAAFVSSGTEAHLALENLPRSIFRTSATVSALMVGVAMATSFAVFVGSFESSTVEWVDQTLPADLWITSAGSVAGGGDAEPMNNDLREALTSLPGVEAVERVRLDDIEYRGYPVKLVASDLAASGPRIKLMMLEGTQDDALRAMIGGAVVVAENFARRFDVHRGSRIALSTKNGERWFDVAGVIVDYTSDTGMLMMDRGTYTANFGDERVDTYKLYLAKGSDPEPTRRAINERFADAYDLFVLTNHEFRDEIIAMLDQAFAVMHLLEVVAIVISVLGVVNAMLANVLDRVRELGILRAVGMLRRQVVRMVIWEGWLVGVMGIVGGVALGLVIGQVLLGYINLTQTGWYLPYRPSFRGIVETALLVAGGSALASYYPANNAARLAITEALACE